MILDFPLNLFFFSVLSFFFSLLFLLLFFFFFLLSSSSESSESSSESELLESSPESVLEEESSSESSSSSVSESLCCFDLLFLLEDLYFPVPNLFSTLLAAATNALKPPAPAPISVLATEVLKDLLSPLQKYSPNISLVGLSFCASLPFRSRNFCAKSSTNKDFCLILLIFVKISVGVFSFLNLDKKAVNNAAVSAKWAAPY